jgi:hemerythrin superfamily protein
MSASTIIETTSDVVAFLKSQHEQVKLAFADVKATTGPEREQAFVDLRQMLAVHETAEELIVHPRAKKEIPNGGEVVDARLQEEHEAKEALAALEKMDVDSTEFEIAFEKLHTAVLAHAEAEETQEFDKLETELDPGELDKMRVAVERAESMAPTRPHPAAGESRAANMLAGPFAAMLDRARDAMNAPE